MKLLLIATLSACAGSALASSGPAIVFVRSPDDTSRPGKQIIVRRLDPVTFLPTDEPQRHLDRLLPFVDRDISDKIVCTGDFDGDGKRDLLIQQPNKRLYIWFTDGDLHVTREEKIAYNLKDSQKPFGAGDLNRDGKDDVVIYDTGNDAKYVKAWLMDGSHVTARVPVVGVPPNYVPRGVGDFDGDGVADILEMKLYDKPDRLNADGPTIQFVHYDAGTQTLSKGDFVRTHNASQWVLVGVGDFNNDGKADLLFYGGALRVEQRRELKIRIMDGASETQFYTPMAPKFWEPVAVWL